MKLTKRETATVLAALRSWQQDLQEGDLIPEEDFPDHFELEEPLKTGEIDALCEKINREDISGEALEKGVGRD